MQILDIKEIIKKIRLPIFLAEIFLFLSNPKQYLEARSDYKKTFADASFLRNVKFNVEKNNTAVLALASGMIYEIKILAMLAFGLKTKGWRVIVLSSKYYFWAKRYFVAFGISEFVSWENVKLSKNERNICEKQLKFFRDQSMTFQSVKKWEYRGASIGPQIISTVSRFVMQGAPNVKDPFIQEKIFSILPETLQIVHISEKLLDLMSPHLIVLIEANYAKMGVLVDSAIGKGIDVIQAIQPARDDALIFKKLNKETRRYHAFSVSLSTLQSFEKIEWSKKHEEKLRIEFENRYGGKWFLQSRNQPNVSKKSNEQIIEQLKLDPAKKTAVVFSHILWDANLFYGEDLFEDYGDWFVQTVMAACRNPNVNWVVKLHPANLWKRARENVTGEFSEETLIKEHIGKLPSHVKLLYPSTDINTLSLFEFADYGITVRGSIGMELPCFGVPVLTAGTGRYSELGFTIDSATKEEYLEKLAHIQEIHRMDEEKVILAKKHAYIMFILRPWTMKSFKAVFNYKKSGVHVLDSNLLFNAKSAGEIRANKDLEKWADWAADRSKVDYIGTC